MTLKEWLDLQGVGGKTHLSKTTGFTWTTIHSIVTGKHVPRGHTAVRISDATGGAVSVGEVIAHALSAREEREGKAA